GSARAFSAAPAADEAASSGSPCRRRLTDPSRSIEALSRMRALAISTAPGRAPGAAGVESASARRGPAGDGPAAPSVLRTGAGATSQSSQSAPSCEGAAMAGREGAAVAGGEAATIEGGEAVATEAGVGVATL